MLTWPGGIAGAVYGSGGRLKRRPSFIRPLAVALIGRVGLQLCPLLLVQAPLGLLQALAAIARNRPGLLCALRLELALGLAQPRPPALAGTQLLGQLVATSLAIQLVFGGVDGLGLFEDRARDLLVIHVRVAAGVARQLRPIDRDHADTHQSLPRAQRQHFAEQVGDRLLVAINKARDRRVVRLLLRRDHAKRDVLLTRPLDHARRTRPARVGVQQQRDHHRRVIRRPAATVDAIGAIERVEVHLTDRVDDKPRQVA